MTDVCKRPWAAIPDSLDVVINLQQVLVCPNGADTSEIDALIEAGFVISNVTVLDVTPLYLTFYVRLWRYETAEEKKLYPPARSPRGRPCRRRIRSGCRRRVMAQAVACGP